MPGRMLVRRLPVPPGGLDPAFVYRGMNHVLVGGQSLSVGVNSGVALSTTQPYANRMFPAGIICSFINLGSFVPLLEGADVETGWHAMTSLVSRDALVLCALQPPGQQSHDMLVSDHGAGGAAYSVLKKNGSGAYFANGMAQVTAGLVAASALGKSYAVRAVCIVHGETDCSLDNQNYGANVTEWQADYDASVKAITGQTLPVVMFHSQMASWAQQFGLQSSIPIQQLAASVASGGKIVMVGPKYMVQYSDGLHLTAAGYRHMGEYYAKAYRRVVLEGLPWEPLRPTLVQRSGAVITVTFTVPVGPLVLDTTRVVNPGNFGFEYTDAGSSPAISSVALVGTNQVAITLASTPTGSNKRLRYAYTATGPAVASGPVTGPRGCLRDSDVTVSRFGFDLSNWCVVFDEAVT